MTRQEHLNWCKQRAMLYVNSGDYNQAFTSMCSGLMKHDETKHHSSTNRIGMLMLMAGELNSRDAMAKWIQGYN